MNRPKATMTALLDDMFTYNPGYRCYNLPTGEYIRMTEAYMEIVVSVHSNEVYGVYLDWDGDISLALYDPCLDTQQADDDNLYEASKVTQYWVNLFSSLIGGKVIDLPAMLVPFVKEVEWTHLHTNGWLEDRYEDDSIDYSVSDWMEAQTKWANSEEGKAADSADLSEFLGLSECKSASGMPDDYDPYADCD